MGKVRQSSNGSRFHSTGRKKRVYEFPEDGLYTIECSGKQASGIMTVNFSGQE